MNVYLSFNVDEKNLNQGFRLKNIEKINIYFIKEINQKELMSQKYKNICMTLNSIEHLRISGSTVTGGVFVSVFASLICIPVAIDSSAIGLRICAITEGIKKSRIKKKIKSMIK